MTTITTTTPKPLYYNYKNPKVYDRNTGTQYNEYQARNEYPPMSSYSNYKW